MAFITWAYILTSFFIFVTVFLAWVTFKTIYTGEDSAFEAARSKPWEISFLTLLVLVDFTMVWLIKGYGV